MPERHARINLTNLPTRSRQLNPEDVRNVFGGCMMSWQLCHFDSDCCYPLKCLMPGTVFQYCLNYADWSK